MVILDAKVRRAQTIRGHELVCFLPINVKYGEIRAFKLETANQQN